MAIGQGETTMSPLQLAVAYSAMLNGGKIWNPTLGWAVVDSAGHVVKTITPTVKNKVPVAQSTLSFIANALHFTADHTVSGALAFDGAPYKTSIGGKTGTAEVEGKQDTSWLASWGPIGTDAAGNPTAKFVVVGMIEQAGTGASAAAPMVREVYNAILGVGQPAVLPDVLTDHHAAQDRALGAGDQVTGLLARDPTAPLTDDLAPVAPRRREDEGRTDWWLVGTTLLLASIGAILVWSATRSTQQAQHLDPQAYLYRHVLNMAIGGVLLFAASRVDARLLRLFGPVLYVGSLLGLMAVFVVGSTINGAHAWIVIGGGFELQPAEFMKLGLIVGMAVLFAERSANRLDEKPTTADILIAVVLIAVPLGLIMLQPDLGSAMVLCAAAFGVLLAADVPARWTLGLIIFGVAGAIGAVQAGVLKHYQLARFAAFTHPNIDRQGVAYNITQAHIAVANGGLWGTGLFHGPQTNGAFVPEQQTDFVFSVAGEELGFVGSIVIIALFAFLCWRGLRIARAADPAGRLIASGIVCWFAFQAFQNIGMNLGLTPVTGLPLPFVSYGGSSMFAEGIAVGLLVAIGRRPVR